MIRHHQEAIYVFFENKERFQLLKSFGGIKIKRFIKEPEAMIRIFGEEYTDMETFIGVVSFILGALKAFLQNSMGKSKSSWHVNPDQSALHDTRSDHYATILSVMKREEDHNNVLVLESMNENGDVLHSQSFDRCTCGQLEYVLAKAFSAISPDRCINDDELAEAIKDYEWEVMPSIDRKRKIKNFTNWAKRNKRMKYTHYAIPSKVIKTLGVRTDGECNGLSSLREEVDDK